MYLKSLEIAGFKSFGKKSDFSFDAPITAIVGPNGSGKSNVAEAFRFVLGEQSIKSLRGKKGEDLIFSGATTRLNRAQVKVVFDNQKRNLAIDFDEVSIERVVHRDGTNEYAINGTRVRLRDVVELLAQANIGASGHHIISQGEADRVLAATPKERRAIIEDALGLRLYQYKKQESQRKLLKTEENRAQVEALRKENQPHLKFLERQVAKAQKALELKEAVALRYRRYLRREEAYLLLEEEALAHAREAPEARARAIDERVRALRAFLEEIEAADTQRDEILRLEASLSNVRRRISDVARQRGTVDAELSFECRQCEEAERRRASVEHRTVSVRVIQHFVASLQSLLDALVPGDVSFGERLESVKQHVRGFLQEVTSVDADTPADRAAIERLEIRARELEDEANALGAEEERLQQQYRALQERMAKDTDGSRVAERELFSLMQEQTTVRLSLEALSERQTRLVRRKEEFRRELAEAAALVGRDILAYKSEALLDDEGNPLALESLLSTDRSIQEASRRDLERQKIRLEELGGAHTEELMKEYEEVRARDMFLEKELTDLVHSAESLRALIEDLERELSQRFNDGISLISRTFQELFLAMFGGGSASLEVVSQVKKRAPLSILLEEGVVSDEDDTDEGIIEETGVDIHVTIPNKRVKGLMMLSGGERALTSIALIFAMSRVNPPPFLILDETDAALDEANSRRYADMIESLAKQSQLIVITHNRETMSRAGVLYGVTMGQDGVSRLLSVAFDEGIKYAK